MNAMRTNQSSYKLGRRLELGSMVKKKASKRNLNPDALAPNRATPPS